MPSCDFLSFMYLGGRDDAKVLIPTTIVLRHMFAPAELRVSILHPEYLNWIFSGDIHFPGVTIHNFV